MTHDTCHRCNDTSHGCDAAVLLQACMNVRALTWHRQTRGAHRMVDRPLMASLTDVYTGERVMLSSRFTSRTVACAAGRPDCLLLFLF